MRGNYIGMRGVLVGHVNACGLHVNALKFFGMFGLGLEFWTFDDVRGEVINSNFNLFILI